MNRERKSEEWVDFTRYYCKEGYIDRWLGDSINNPNNPKEHQMCLNSVAEYFRLNGAMIMVGIMEAEDEFMKKYVEVVTEEIKE